MVHINSRSGSVDIRRRDQDMHEFTCPADVRSLNACHDAISELVNCLSRIRHHDVTSASTKSYDAPV